MSRRDTGRLHRRVGCEWTWQTASSRKDITWDQVQEVRSYLDRNHIKYYKHPATDDYCLEIPTPPCATLLELKNYWEAYRAATKPLGLIRRSVGRTSGGGHVHVECPHTRAGLVLAQKCVAWSYLNPWIGWVFNDPVDDESARSPENERGNMLTFLTSKNGRDSFDGWYVFSRASHYDKHTVEFRALDMPETWDEAELHVRFVDALVEFVHRMPLVQIEVTVRLNGSGGKASLAKELAARHPYGDSAARFEALVKRLGLRWDDYRPYLRNLKARYRLGTTN